MKGGIFGLKHSREDDLRDDNTKYLTEAKPRRKRADIMLMMRKEDAQALLLALEMGMKAGAGGMIPTYQLNGLDMIKRKLHVMLVNNGRIPKEFFKEVFKKPEDAME